MEDLLKSLDAKASEIEATFEKAEADGIAALRIALDHLRWALTTKPIPKHRRHITAVAYSSRVMHHTHGAYRLGRAGNTISAEIVSRAALEAAFVVGAMANDDNFSGENDFYLRLLFKSTLAKKKTLEGFLDTADHLDTNERDRCLQEIAALQAELGQLESHQMSKTSAIAKAAGMEDYYAREYASQSRTLHSDLEVVIEDHVETRQGDLVVRGIVFDISDAKFQIATLIAAVMETATSIAQLLDLEIPEAELRRTEKAKAFYRDALQTPST